MNVYKMEDKTVNHVIVWGCYVVFLAEGAQAAYSSPGPAITLLTVIDRMNGADEDKMVYLWACFNHDPIGKQERKEETLHHCPASMEWFSMTNIRIENSRIWWKWKRKRDADRDKNN